MTAIKYVTEWPSCMAQSCTKPAHRALNAEGDGGKLIVLCKEHATDEPTLKGDT